MTAATQPPPRLNAGCHQAAWQPQFHAYIGAYMRPGGSRPSRLKGPCTPCAAARSTAGEQTGDQNRVGSAEPAAP